MPSEGFAIEVPDGWYRADEAMSRITDPHELLTLSTVPLSWRETDCEAFAGAAGAGMGARDVVVTVWERERGGGDGFPPRPERLAALANPEPAGEGCGEPAGTLNTNPNTNTTRSPTRSPAVSPTRSPARSPPTAPAAIPVRGRGAAVRSSHQARSVVPPRRCSR